MGQGGNGLNHDSVGVLCGYGARAIVGWGDFNYVHGNEVDTGYDITDCPEELAGGHTAGLGGAGAGGEAGVEDIDVNGEVYELGAVQGLTNSLVHDYIKAALIELGHEVPVHSLFFHPVPDLGGGPVASEADLDEVPRENGATFDETSHGATVGNQAAAKAVGGSVGVGVEVDYANSAPAPGVGDGGGGGAGLWSGRHRG